MMLPYVRVDLLIEDVNFSLLRSTDYILVQDKSFKGFAKAYADDVDLFFKE
jgi:hypothetical protein